MVKFKVMKRYLSLIKISVVIKGGEMEEAIKALHDAFDLDKELDG